MALPLLFGSALFASAALLFSIQPMFAKMVLPLLGGAPAVWITCMLFFQATLLAGYAYAHVTAGLLSPRRQVATHVALLLLPLFMLPVAVPAGWTPPHAESPVGWLLACLAIALGLPFLVLSATTPLLQKWFVETGHPAGRDPYFLYAASNLGSMIALLAYPVVVEPHLRLAAQSRLWAVGYWLMVATALGCGAVLWRAVSPTRGPSRGSVAAVATEPGAPGLSPRTPSLAQVVHWLALSFVPSSLMLGLTTYLTVDISPMPLLWVGPLVLYLLTFVLLFSRRSPVPQESMARVLPICALLLVMTMSLRAAGPLWLLVALHVGTFFVAAMVCHGELARRRPPAAHLTAFYLTMAAGGALGGIFNALLAPRVFNEVIEYPLAIVLACLLRPSPSSSLRRRCDRWLALAAPLALGGIVPGLAWATRTLSVPDTPAGIVVFGAPALICFALRDRTAAFGLGLAATMLATTLSLGEGGRVLHRERSFFGVSRVSLDGERGHRVLWSGTTAHGFQSLDPAREREPLGYYHRAGPLGQVFGALAGAGSRPPVAIVGLGTGSMACYGEPGQDFTFFEIDPAVERIARDPRYFTFLQVCAPRVRVVLGDARGSLERAPDRRYGLLVLDAFSSDAIPTHLLTREALRLYLRKLTDGGLLAFHISNRYLDLEPVLAGLMQEAGLVGLVRHDHAIPEADRRRGRTEADWVVISRRVEDLSALPRTPGWGPLTRARGEEAWSDDFSSTLRVIRWR